MKRLIMARRTNKEYKIGIIGTGYVGLVTGACFSHLGYRVLCCDNNRKKIELLKNLKMPIYEPGLESLVKEGVKKNRLHFTTSIKQTVKNSDVIFIAVGTPSSPTGEPDLSSVEWVSRTIAQHMNSYKLIVEKSTVPVETGKKVKQTLRLYARRKVEFDVASNPEFLREGSAVKDFLNPDRIVIGVDSVRAKDILLGLYSPFQCPVVVTNIETAEIIKHASNSFLAARISFINLVSQLCEKVGADIKLVSFGMGLDKRIGLHYLEAGLGFGGPCLEKDLQAFSRIFKIQGIKAGLLEEALYVNTFQKESFLNKIKNILWVLKGKNISVLGLSFKPNTDDMRNSPSIYIIENLLEEKAKVKVYDPQAMKKARGLFGKKVSYCKSAYDALQESEAAIFITEWEEFKNINWSKAKKLMRHPIIFDGRNMFEPSKLDSLGFKYFSIGR